MAADGGRRLARRGPRRRVRWCGWRRGLRRWWLAGVGGGCAWDWSSGSGGARSGGLVGVELRCPRRGCHVLLPAGWCGRLCRRGCRAMAVPFSPVRSNRASGPTAAAARPAVRRLGGAASRHGYGGGLATSSGGSRLGGCGGSISLVRLLLPAIQIRCGSAVASRRQLWLSSGPPRQGLGRGRSLVRPSLASSAAMWAPCRRAWPGSCWR